MDKAAPGTALRNRVAELLRLHYSNVELEVRVGATTADVLYVDDTQSLFPRKFAIEAKDWGRPLTSQDIANIYVLYQPALMDRTIDHLLIVGNHVLAGSPRQTIDGMAQVAYITFANFQSSLINFHPILDHNVVAFEDDPSFSIFIETRVRKSNVPLLSAVDDWLETDQTGLVVYGGYGLGKTTFSKYLAHTLTKRYAQNGGGRIPIRFTLGDIYHKQDLTALISSSLAAGEGGAAVKNFSYRLFIEMNRLGSLVLIFDGFDEMRHAIELEDFVFNFQQMRSLISGRAKVIILGRPDAFLSTAEELKVLSSLFDNPKQVSDKLGLLEVAFFSEEDVRLYLKNFMDVREFDATKRAKVEKLLALMPPADEENILSRPVQLKMFTEVIDDFIDDELLLSRFKLYEAFIYKFIIREKRKLARSLKDISGTTMDDPRARFMQNIAWWILITKKENRFLPSEISRSLIPFEIAQRHETEAAVREALVGSVVEPMGHSGVLGKKTNRFYYFPHKSYIEFLVAQYFSNASFTIEMYRDFIQNVTPEIVSFIEEGTPGGVENLKRGIDHATARIPRFLIDAAARSPSVAKEIMAKSVEKPRAARIYLYYLHLQQTGGDVADFLRQQITNGGSSTRLIAICNCTADYLISTGDRQLARFWILNFLTRVFDEHKLLAYLRQKKFAEFFRDDEMAARAGALLGTVELSSSGITLFPGRLTQFALIASANTQYVEMGGNGPHQRIFLGRDFLLPDNERQEPLLAAFVNELLKAAVDENKRVAPVTLKGEAERRYSI